jgi:hypothetical protein
MRNKPYRKGERLIESLASGVFVFMKQLFPSARLTGLGGRKLTGLIGFLEFFFIFWSLHVVYSVLSAREGWADSRVVRFALPIMKVFKLRLNFSELF